MVETAGGMVVNREVDFAGGDFALRRKLFESESRPVRYYVKRSE